MALFDFMQKFIPGASAEDPMSRNATIANISRFDPNMGSQLYKQEQRVYDQSQNNAIARYMEKLYGNPEEGTGLFNSSNDMRINRLLFNKGMATSGLKGLLDQWGKASNAMQGSEMDIYKDQIKRKEEAGQLDSVVADRYYENYQKDVDTDMARLQSFGDIKDLVKVVHGRYNPQADTALIYQVAKMVDPGGRISDADYANWESKNYPAIMQGFLNKMGADGTLDDQSRQDLLEMASRYYNRSIGSLAKKQAFHKKAASQAGIPVSQLYDESIKYDPYTYDPNFFKGNNNLVEVVGDAADKVIEKIKPKKKWKPGDGPKEGIFWAEE